MLAGVVVHVIRLQSGFFLLHSVTVVKVEQGL